MKPVRGLRLRSAGSHSIDKRRGGFTLVELLVVVVIIVALGAVAVALLMNQREKAVEGVLDSDAREIEGLLLNALSLEEPVTYSGGTVSTPTRSFTSSAGDIDLSASFPSGSVPSVTDCITISLPSESTSREVCIPGAGGGPGGFTVTYPSSPFAPGSNNQTLSPNVSGAIGPISYTLDGTLPNGFTFDPNTGLITGPESSEWPFPAANATPSSLPGWSGTYASGVLPTDDGGTYSIGSFMGTVEFGDHTIASAGDTDFYVAKQDASGEWL